MIPLLLPSSGIFLSPMSTKYQKNAKTLKNSLYFCEIKANTY